MQLDEDTVWHTQAQMAELFGVNSQVVNRHLGNIYESGELDEDRTCSKMEQVRQEGSRSVRRQVKAYNLDAVISVGYHVNIKEATGLIEGAIRAYAERIKRYPFLEDELAAWI